MSQEWVYKARDTKLDYTGTTLLANLDGFLCRSTYNAKEQKSAGNIHSVSIGDKIHFYFSRNGKDIAPIGSFEVIDPNGGHRHVDAFGDRIGETALFQVKNPAFIKRHDPYDAYKLDPVLDVYTGWALRKIGPPPAYHAKMFSGQGTLQEYKPGA